METLFNYHRADPSSVSRERSNSAVCRYVCALAICAAAVLGGVSMPPVAQAQTGISYTITPPLFQLSMDPGSSWSSTIRVVNGNPYSMQVYADPLPFTPEGETGRPRFDMQDYTHDEAVTGLASWITVPDNAIFVPAEGTVEVPVRITVPSDAEPGGHYAAVLIGNRAGEAAGEGSTVSVASAIASLFFLSVSGDVVERARIRDFATEEYFYQSPEARLSLRFENQGNVHVRPKGTIIIYNMFGKVRGRVELNQGEHFGNVLPGSIRKFTFSWMSESGWWDIGRYRAEATVGYGASTQQFAHATTYFYILPIVPLLEVIGAVLLLVLIFVFSVRAYIRKALALERTRAAYVPADLTGESQPPATEVREAQPERHAEPQLEFRSLIRPIEASMVDLRRVATKSAPPPVEQGAPTNVVHNQPYTLLTFLRTYRYFFLFVVTVAAVWLVASALLEDVLTYERPYNVIIEKDE
jgi:hypothetical protein